MSTLILRHMAETLLSFGVQKLWELLVRESDRFKEVNEQLTVLKSDVNLLRSFLKDVDAKKHASSVVRNCVEEIKEIVFDAEDVIETFLLKKELGRTSGIRKRMRRLAFTIADRRELVSQMEGISKRISKVIRDMQSFGVQQRIVDGSGYSDTIQEKQREMRHTFPSDNESHLVGLEEKVKKLVGYLVEEESIQVVSICGMGGIGKTTLARQVFSHEMVKKHFDGVVWVCVSQQFTRKYVWQTIFQRFSSNHDEHRGSDMTEDELQDKLFRLLETSKSLIVLDDMWREDDWDNIKHVFPPTKGWKVLFTSRNENVALRADPECVTFKLKCLTPKESWTLFRRIAFPRIDTSEFKVDVDMLEMGKKMIKHCGGLPLAVKVLGGLLAAQPTLSEWKRVYENIGSHLAGGTSFNDGYCNSVHSVLSLSFEELPTFLKHYFLYLVHFPRDYQISVENLSYYWAAEGIPRPSYSEGATIEEVAEGYIADLVKRNMVISEKNASTSKFETCHLHDMMREVCLLKTEEENFLQIVHGSSSTAYSKSYRKSRRLAVHRPDETFSMEKEVNSPSLRSLLFIWGSNWKASGLFFERLQLMRVLDLSRAHFEGGKIPSSIGKLIHLRYLSLYKAHVSRLPSSMRNLKQLVYLNLCLYARYPLYVPNIFKGMQELRYLSLPSGRMHDKTKLELGNLINLETLKFFSTKHSSVTDLHCMTRLRNLLIIFNEEGCTMETLSSSLSKLRHLESLSIDYNHFKVFAPTDDEKGFVLGCIHLKKLELCIYMPGLPDENHLPSHLTTISLTGCRLKEDPMLILEKLSHLKEVDLGKRSFCGKKMVCSRGGFPQLQMLLFLGLHEWEEWIVEKGSMPLLHTLDVSYCAKLKEVPNGIQFLTSLKDLCMGEEWKKRLSEEGEDYYKVQHVISVRFGGKG
ncbi:hypothetical protein F2Q68_00003614 [Brassica cretica]|uniref:Disease resistance protein n=1 Tax=Brassica cretica TaxID=69181 RepID=A0A8S9J5W6_BRACR|nr:hypothetical protein F2Q68_00003614 [Brassica cretica]